MLDIRDALLRYGFAEETGTSAVSDENSASGWLDVLSRVMNVGLLLVGPAGRLEFANALALELLGCRDPHDQTACRYNSVIRAEHRRPQPADARDRMFL